MRRVRTWVLAGLLALAFAVLVERCQVSEEERVEAAWRDLAEAAEQEDAGRLRGRLVEGFAYRGPRPVGEGELDEAMEGLRGWWGQAEAIRVIERKLEMDLEGRVARLEAATLVRFSWGGGTAVYRVRMILAMQQVEGRWLLRDLEILEMSPGIF